MFSVLISIYKSEDPDHFHSCMESIIIFQTLKPSQVVIVEDGPLTDYLYEKINFWKLELGDVLKIIKLEKNVGVGIAKNIGLKACENEIICIVDTDDICVPFRFQKQVDFLKSNLDIAICGGQISEFVLNPKNSLKTRRVPSLNKELYKFAKRRSPFNNMTIAYRKSVIEEVGGYQHHLWMEDYNLFLRIIAKGYKIYNFDEVFVYARIDNGMHKRRRGLEYIKSEFQLLNLKKKLKLQNSVEANFIFMTRSIVRLFPSFILKNIYKFFLRKN